MNIRTEDIIQFIFLILETLMLILVFSCIRTNSPKDKARRVAAYICIFATRAVFQMFTPSVTHADTLMWAIKHSGVLLFLILEKKQSVKNAIYITVLTWLPFISSATLLGVPFTSNMLKICLVSVGVRPDAAGVIILVFTRSVGLLLCYFVSKGLKLDCIGQVGNDRLAMIFMVFISENVISKLQRIEKISSEHSFDKQLSISIILLNCFVYFVVFLYERYVKERDAKLSLQIEKAMTKYRYETTVAKENAKSNIRKVYHDMKNHLIAIRNIGESNEKLRSYVDSLLNEMSVAGASVETGNRMLNGLLSEKIKVAEEHGICININLDYRSCGYIDDMDTCVIFGNALDNAIEACSDVCGEKLITVEGYNASGNLIVKIRNPYSGELNICGNNFITTKADSSLHGIGLSSIRHAMKKNNGSVVIDVETPGVFSLMLIFEKKLQQHGQTQAHDFACKV